MDRYGQSQDNELMQNGYGHMVLSDQFRIVSVYSVFSVVITPPFY